MMTFSSRRTQQPTRWHVWKWIALAGVVQVGLGMSPSFGQFASERLSSENFKDLSAAPAEQVDFSLPHNDDFVRNPRQIGTLEVNNREEIEARQTHSNKVQALVKQLVSQAGAEKEENLEALKDLLSEEFDRMHAAESQRIENLKEQLKKIVDRHEKRLENRGIIVERRMEAVLGQQDSYGWMPAQPQASVPSSVAGGLPSFPQPFVQQYATPRPPRAARPAATLDGFPSVPQVAAPRPRR